MLVRIGGAGKALTVIPYADVCGRAKSPVNVNMMTGESKNDNTSLGGQVR